jgi:hypothetical protein
LGQRIKEEIKKSAIDVIFDKHFGLFQSTFYKKGLLFIGGYIGYTVAVGKERRRVYEQVINSSEKIINKALD